MRFEEAELVADILAAFVKLAALVTDAVSSGVSESDRSPTARGDTEFVEAFRGRGKSSAWILVANKKQKTINKDASTIRSGFEKKALILKVLIEVDT